MVASKFFLRLLASLLILSMTPILFVTILSPYIELWKSILCALFAAFGLAILFAKRIYAPIKAIKKIARSLEPIHETRKPLTSQEDEFGFLGKTLKRMAQELSQQISIIGRDRVHLQAILTGMAEGVLAVDQENRVLFSNESAQRFLFHSPTQKKEKLPLTEVVRVSDVLELIDDVWRQRVSLHKQIHVYREGKETILEARAAPVTLEGMQGVVMVFRDMTEAKKLEKIRQDFVANASHELKTPLTVIKGYVDSLLDGGEKDSQIREHFLKQISESVNNINRLVEDLLSLSKAESEEGRLELANMDALHTVATCIEKYRLMAQKKGLELETNLPKDPVHILGNSRALEEVLDNLLENAIKYTNHGKVSLSVKLENTYHVLIEVADTGIGISPSEMDRIFERFYRVDKARSKEVGGTGLGLSIVKHLVQNLNGAIEVKNQLGKGSRFILKFPLS